MYAAPTDRFFCPRIADFRFSYQKSPRSLRPRGEILGRKICVNRRNLRMKKTESGKQENRNWSRLFEEEDVHGASRAPASRITSSREMPLVMPISIALMRAWISFSQRISASASAEASSRARMSPARAKSLMFRKLSDFLRNSFQRHSHFETIGTKRRPCQCTVA